MNETIDRLYHLGADVITARDAPIHASGHGYAGGAEADAQPDQPALRDAGPRRLQADQPARRARRGGGHRPPRTSSAARTACRWRSTSEGARFGEREQAGMVFVDGVDVGDIEDVALRDRRMLSADGIFIVVATISEQDGRSVAEPEIIFRGVPFIDEPRRPGRGAARRGRGFAGAIGRGGHPRDRLLQSHLHDDLAEFVYRAPEAAADGAAGGRGGLARPALAAPRRRWRRGSAAALAPLDAARTLDVGGATAQ